LTDKDGNPINMTLEERLIAALRRVPIDAQVGLKNNCE
jgi:hypothetical protein